MPAGGWCQRRPRARPVFGSALILRGELSNAARALTPEPCGTSCARSTRWPSFATAHCRPLPTRYHQGPRSGRYPGSSALCPCLPTSIVARRGCAAGFSGATNEHVRTLLDDEEDAQLLHKSCSKLRRTQNDHDSTPHVLLVPLVWCGVGFGLLGPLAFRSTLLQVQCESYDWGRDCASRDREYARKCWAFRDISALTGKGHTRLEAQTTASFSGLSFRET